MNNLADKLIQNYKNMPDKVCIIQKENKITYKDLYNIVANFKEQLEKDGIKKGDKVLVLVPMSIELYVSLLAVWAIGAVPCFMDEGFIKSGMNKNDFNDINAIIGTTKYILYSNINSNLRKLKIRVNVNKIGNRENNRLEVTSVYPNTSAILTYTSGTTGKPKVASRTHEFLEWQGKILEQTINYEDTDVEISSMPIFTLSNINVGITSVIADGDFSNLGNSDPSKIVKQIYDNNANRIMAAPGLLTVITNYCLSRKIVLDKIKKIYTGGGAVFIDFINDLKKVFPEAQIVTLYGSTEAEPIAELNVNEITEEDLEKIKSGHGIPAGKIVGVEDCRTITTDIEEIGEITSEEFKNMEQELGEIVVTGKNVLKGYVNGVGDKENKFTVDGEKYHRTGDLGVIDEKGWLWLRGRVKQPYFNIEAALHAKLNIGKTAVFCIKGKIILVLENQEISERFIRESIKFEKIDEIKYVSKIPVDKRHSTKVDYNELRRMLNM